MVTVATLSLPAKMEVLEMYWASAGCPGNQTLAGYLQNPPQALGCNKSPVRPAPRDSHGLVSDLQTNVCMPL